MTNWQIIQVHFSWQFYLTKTIYISIQFLFSFPNKVRCIIPTEQFWWNAFNCTVNITNKINISSQAVHLPSSNTDELPYKLLWAAVVFRVWSINNQPHLHTSTTNQSFCYQYRTKCMTFPHGHIPPDKFSGRNVQGEYVQGKCPPRGTNMCSVFVQLAYYRLSQVPFQDFSSRFIYRPDTIRATSRDYIDKPILRYRSQTTHGCDIVWQTVRTINVRAPPPVTRLILMGDINTQTSVHE